MSLIQRFRLTKQLHDQVEMSGESVDTVLRSWNDKDFKSLCEYVSQCTGVVPKYVGKLAELTGLTPKAMVMEILGAQMAASGSDDDEDGGKDYAMGYLPEDAMEKAALLSSFVHERQRY